MANDYSTITVQQVLDAYAGLVSAAQDTAMTAMSLHTGAVQIGEVLREPVGDNNPPPSLDATIQALIDAKADAHAAAVKAQELQDFVDKQFFSKG